MCSGTESRTRLNQKNRIVFVCNFRCRLPDRSDDQIIGNAEWVKAVLPFILPLCIVLYGIGDHRIRERTELLHIGDAAAQRGNKLFRILIPLLDRICSITQGRSRAVKFLLFRSIVSFGIKGQDSLAVIRSQIRRDIGIHLLLLLRGQRNMVRNLKALYAELIEQFPNNICGVRRCMNFILNPFH